MNNWPHATASASPASSTCCAVSFVNFSFAMYGPPNCFLQLRAETVLAERFARGDERDLALAEFARDIAEGLSRIRIAHVVRVAARREMHADAIRAPHVDTCVGDFEQQTRAVFNGAAVLVGALVGAVLKELVDQIAVRAVHFDAVEACGFRVFRAFAECLRPRPRFRRVRARAA